MNGWKLEAVNKIKFDKYLDMPVPKEDELLIRIEACGICGSDVPRTYKTGAHRMPLTIGHEFAGTVVDTNTDIRGENTDCLNEEGLANSGQRVGVFPLIPCRKCASCRQKKYEMCSSYSYLGSRTDGGFAEYVSVPKWNLIKLPDDASFEQAAMLEPMAVAVHAMRQVFSGLRNESEDNTKNISVAVCGMGTIGQLLVMFLMDLGIKNVYAIGNKASQKESLINIGLSEENYFDAKSDQKLEEWTKSKTDGIGFEVYFECVGNNQTINQGIDMLAPSGKLVVVGNPASDVFFDQNTYWKILRKQLTIKGTWNSSFLGEEDPEALGDDWHYVLTALKEGRIRPEKLITHRFALEDLEKGLQIMRDKSEDYIKIMISAL